MPKVPSFALKSFHVTERVSHHTLDFCTTSSTYLVRSRYAASSLLPTKLVRSVSSSSSLPKKQRAFCGSTTIVTFASLSVALLTAWQFSSTLHAETPSGQGDDKTQDFREEELSDVAKRIFRLSEVSSHNQDSENPWLIKGTKVYDITDWIAAHPGGDVILRAAGGSVEPCWNIFSIHKKQEFYDILESYLIGNVDPQDKAYSMSDLRSNFKQHKITAVLQCSGNRRSQMTEGSRPTNGLQWKAGAIGNAE